MLAASSPAPPLTSPLRANKHIQRAHADLCILLALIVGVPLAIRAYGEGGMRHRDWGTTSSPSLPDWADLPPRLAMRRPPPMMDGQWQSLPDPTPPWGATGGGHSQLLPPPQDDRFGMDNS